MSTITGSIGAPARREAAVAPGAGRRLALLCGVLFVAASAPWFVTGGALTTVRHEEPFDLDINLVAAQRLVHHEPLYDRAASKPQAQALGGRLKMSTADADATNSFAGPPSTALLHVPFLAFSHGTGVAVFRVLSLLGMLGAVALAAGALPPGWRVIGGLFGSGVLIGSFATFDTLLLGQGHEFVMLGLAAAVWGASRDRWKVAGIGVGVATVLKLSPALLIVYLVLRGRRQAAGYAVGTVAAATLAAAVLGRPQDLLVWAKDVVPGLSAGTFRAMNQSLPALAMRMASTRTDLNASFPLGTWHLLALPVLLGGIYALWWVRRGQAFDPLELGVVVLVVLLAGPLSWQHYATWAVLPMVLLVDPRRWARRRPAESAAAVLGLAAAVALMAVQAVPPTAAAVRADWWLRVSSSPEALAEVLLLAVGLWALRGGPAEPLADPGGSVGRPDAASLAL